MPHSTHGIVALMGSGEMAPSMVEAHKRAMSLITGKVRSVFLDTPAGFQLNADLLAEKAVEYFRDHLNMPLDVMKFKSVDKATREELQTAVRQIVEATYVFAGPGSPTYAIRNWLTTPIRDALLETLAHGGCLTFASAAALTLGRFTIPVYEIYKVGDAPYWSEGLDILGHSGLDVAVVPHWNNTSGGDHDTTFCFVGEPRWRDLESQLPPGTVVLGIDEHTACILRLNDGICEVRGVGAVTVRRAGQEQVFQNGDTFSLDLLRSTTGEMAPLPERQSDQPTAPDLSWEAIRARHESLHKNSQPALPEVASYVYDLMALMSRARQSGDWESLHRAEEAIREALVTLIARLGSGPGNVDELIGPYLDLLVELRDQFRASRQWEQADVIRSRLTGLGIVLEDSPEGTRWRSNS